MLRLALVFVCLLAAPSLACDGDDSSIDLVAEANRSGLWTEDRTAAAVSFVRDACTAVYVIRMRADGEHVTTDVSRIEDGLFAKLGTSPRSDYERYETAPVSLSVLDDGSLFLTVRLRVWRDGQRSTVSAPVIVRPDGTVLWQ